jgi:hypothetical protein
MSATYIHEAGDGRLIEYRLGPRHPCVLFVEHRLLRPGGTPYDERWYPLPDAHLSAIQREGSDIIELLSEEARRR